MSNRQNTFLLKGSNIPGKIPTAGDLQLKELAINFADVILYASGTTANSILPIGWDRVARTGDTMTGGLFTPYLSATTISATTYLNLPKDITVTGGTYSNGNATFTNNTGGTFSVTGFTTGTTVWTTGSTGLYSIKAINDSNINATGNYAVAEGYGTIASGIASHSEGSGTTASGLHSHAEGLQTRANGNYSHTEGRSTTTFGASSHAEGGFTTATGDYSHAEGASAIALGAGSHAEGGSTLASGPYSHSEGGQTTASGFYSHAEGYLTIASGNFGSHAEGSGTTASGDYSHAEGVGTKAIGIGGHSEGSGTTASGSTSHAEGSGTTANGGASHAEGQYTTASGIASHTEGYLTIASGDYNHAEGNATISSGTYGSHSEGYVTTSAGQASHSEGQSTKALGNQSHAEGANSVASGQISHAEGYFTTAQGAYGHSEGYRTSAFGQPSHAEGEYTTASGNRSHSEGYYTIALGAAGHAEGQSTTASADYSHSEGFTTIASGQASHSEGSGTTASGIASHAGGNNTKAIGTTSFVHGDGSIASGTTTIVLGNNITGLTSNTVYVPNLNISIIGSGTSINNLGIDSSGNVVIGATGSGSSFTGGTVTGSTNFTNGLTANTFSATSINTVDYIVFNTGTTSAATVAGTVYFDNTEHALSYNTSINQGVTVNLGQQNYIRVFNNTGVDIQRGKALEVLSAYSGLPSVTLAVNKHTGFNIIGVSAEIIPNNSEGIAITYGIISNIELTGITIGSLVYASDIVPGKLDEASKYLNFPLTARTNSVGYVVQTGTTTGKLFVDIKNENSVLSLTDLERNVLEGNTLSTGLFEFTGMTTASTTTFNVAPLKGWLVKNTYEYALTPDVQSVNYTGGTSIPVTNIATADSTYILITSALTVTQQVTFPTPQQRRESIYLGKITHPNRTSILNINNQSDYDVSPMSSLRDLWSPIRLINQGIIPSANGANLSFNTSAGTLWGNGINWHNNQLSPNNVIITAKVPASFSYRTQTGGTSTSVTVIDPRNYDVGGVITSIGNANLDDATNQRIYMYPTGVINVLYGQTRYATLSEAVAAVQSEAFIPYPNAESTGILIGVLSVRNDIGTDGQSLTNPAYAKFTFVSKFGESFGGTGGLSTTTLQQAYDNSTSPEIVINAILDGLSIKNGTGNADNVTNLLEGLDAAGNTTSFIRADGDISGTTLQTNSFTANTTGVSATTVSATTIKTPSFTANATGISASTISATTYYNLPTDIRVTGGTYSNGNTTFTNNTGGTFSVSGFVTGDTYFISGSAGTYSVKTKNDSGLDAIANYSFAQGQGTTATGIASHAEGQDTISTGGRSHAEGYQTTSVGDASHSEGFGTTAQGDFSHSEGRGTTASGNKSHAEGSSSIASGESSHAEGDTTRAIGYASHAEGYFTTANNDYTHAEGQNTISSSDSSHAEGKYTTASGKRAHSEGNYTIASGNDSHAEGSYTTASGDTSHAGGSYTIASGLNSFVHGTGSTAIGNSAIVLGNNITGTTDNTVYVPNLNIKTIGSTTSLYNLGVDSNGGVVIGTAGGASSFSGGTVTGPTNFINGLTATTISATTYLGLPIDVRVTGGTYSNGSATFINNTGGTFNVSGFSTGSTSNILNLVRVGLSGSVGVDYYSIKSAVDSITGATSANTYVVKVGPGVFYEDTITMKSYVDVIGESETNTIIQANNPNATLILGADQSMISDVQIQGCTGTSVAAVVYSSSTTPQLNAIFYVENVRFGENYTHAKTVGTGGGNCIMQCSNVKYGGYPFTLGFYVTNDGSGVGRMQLRNVTSTNGGVTTTTGLIFAKADQPNCAFIINGCLLTKSTVGGAAGTAFWVENGGSLRLTAVNFQRWATGIYAPQTGSAPSIEAIALNFENCTTDVNIIHSGTTGKVQGTDTYSKTLININAPLYEVNQDPRIISVAKKGGDFTSIKSAVDSITGSSASNRFLVSVGPGRFSEGEIDLTTKPYVSIEGSNILTTEIVPSGNTQHIIKIGQNNELSFLSLSGAPSGYAGIYAYDIGDYGQAHKVSFTDCDTNVWVESNTQDTIFYGEYLDFNGSYSYGTKAIGNNGFEALANMENYYNFPTGTGVTICNYAKGSGGTLSVFVGDALSNGVSGSTAFLIESGGTLNTTTTTIDGFTYGFRNPNIGLPVRFDIDNTSVVNCEWDLYVENHSTFGTFGGSSNHEKVYSASENVYWSFLDSNDGEFDITRKISVTFQDGSHTDLSTLVFRGGTMGLISGGTLSVVSGTTIQSDTGFGYLEKSDNSGIVRRINWDASNITLSANTNNYLYFNENSILSNSGSLPPSENNIILGRVVTDLTSVRFIDLTPVNADHTANRFSSLFREGLGSIYAFGSIVTENATKFHIDATAGEYYYSTNKYLPSGGTDLSFTQYYRDGVGGWNTSATTVVNNAYYDGNGSLSALTAGYYTKHTLYTVGSGSYEKYFLVLGQNEYATLIETEDALLPTPPSFFSDSVTQIANIYIKQGFSGITQFEDIRPVIGFKAGGVNASSLHANLLGLSSDDHTQYLLADGVRSMAGNLNMGTNSITNVGTVDGVTVSSHASRHLPSGSDPLSTAAPINVGTSNELGTADSFAKSDHQHALGSNIVNDSNISAHTSTKITIVDKAQLNPNIVYNNQINSGITATTISATTYYGSGVELTGIAHAFSGTSTLDFSSLISGETSFTTTYISNSNINSVSTVMIRFVPSTNHPNASEATIEELVVDQTDIVDGVGFNINAYANAGTWGVYNIVYRIIN